jgi:hypothetical protein
MSKQDRLEREAFEQWAKSCMTISSFALLDDGTYAVDGVEDVWQAWLKNPQYIKTRGSVMTKVTVEHKKGEQPSIFETGNLVVTGTDEIVLVTDKLNGCTFWGVQLAPHNGDTTKYFDKKSCEQFHGTLTLESP